jgi:DNA-binding IclR family transcriptional regulator
MMKEASALDGILASLVSGKGLRLTELARKTGLPQVVVDEVVGFLVRYGFVRVAPDSSSVMLQEGGISPHVLAMILETVLSRDLFFCLKWS